jgi:S-formylglutathione hydrolase FrmB
MKILISLLLFSLGLWGCISTPTESPDLKSLDDCAQLGTVQEVSVDASAKFSLYLPPCPAQNANGLYPVLYLLPGFGGSATDWFYTGLAPVADASILAGEVPPFIIVTTDDSFDDLDASFLVEKIIPYVENYYAASSDRQHRAVAGGSLGGASAYHLAFKHPDLFESAGIFGNGAATGEEDEIRTWVTAIPDSNRPRVFLNSGEGDTYMMERAQVMISLLDEAGIEHAEIFNAGDHSYAYWVSNFPAYFRWLAQGW